MSTILTRSQATAILKALGWKTSLLTFKRDIRNFQAGWNLGTALEVDGKCGPLTSAALMLSDRRRRQNRGTASEHFSFTEVACRCGGKYRSCWRVWQKREAFQMMEEYRARTGRPLNVVSGCRCRSHNKAVGGSPTSRHLVGRACDVPPTHSVADVKSWKLATNIGYSPSMGKVVHLDMGPRGTKSAPMVYPDGK